MECKSKSGAQKKEGEERKTRKNSKRTTKFIQYRFCSKIGFQCDELEEPLEPGPSEEIARVVKMGPPDHPAQFPVDIESRSFPSSLLKCKLPNGEYITRDWIVWSFSKQALYCFPCRLFSNQPETNRSNFVRIFGYLKQLKWKKLYDRIPEHSSSNAHKEYYLKWRDLECRIGSSSNIFNNIQKMINDERQIWRQILVRFLDVTLFLSERGLPFKGESEKLGEPNNGNFLGLLELLSHYDSILKEHMSKVKKSQENGYLLQVHYLSHHIQDEFITTCGQQVRNAILDERKEAKYYSIIVDATPNTSHMEQFVMSTTAMAIIISKFRKDSSSLQLQSPTVGNIEKIPYTPYPRLVGVQEWKQSDLLHAI
ncbi:hypothetical protein JTB14_006673 [Gonioctena quinquepunctata]|nr:hypothetical protein JTB14_006673 [Gonioctena quinquepunctata]